MGLIQKQTIQSTFFSYLGVVAGAITQAWLLPRFFKKEEVGLMAVLMAWTYMAAPFANLGFNTAGIRLFPQFRHADKKHNGYLFLACAVSLLGFLLCFLVLYLMKDVLVSADSILLQKYYFLIFPLTFFTLYFNVFDNYAKSLYDSVTGTFLSQFIQRLFQLFSMLAYSFSWVNFEQFIFLWLIAICFPAVLMAGKILLDGNFYFQPDFKILDKNLRKEIVKICLFSIISGLSTQIITHIDKVMIESYLSLDDVGIYTIASFFGTVIAMPAMGLYKISGTLIADAWKKNDRKTINTIYEKSCISQLIIGLWVFMGIVINLDFIFQVLLPDGYEAGKWVIIWIGLGKLFDMATGVNGVILTTSKDYRYDTYFFLLLIGVVIGCNVLFIKPYGIVGAAISASVAVFFFNFFRFAFVWWRFGFQPFTWATPKILILGIALLLLNSLFLGGGSSFYTQIIILLLRSSLLSILFFSILYYIRVLPEMNNLINQGIQKLAKRL